MLKLFMMIAGLATPFLTSADELPRYDVESHCQEVSDFAGGSHQIFNSCIQMEQSSYNNIREQWSDVEGQIRQHCNEVAAFTGGSYQLLESCVQMETRAGARRETFSFD